jgi:hypothetical protein
MRQRARYNDGIIQCCYMIEIGQMHCNSTEVEQIGILGFL